MIWAEHFAGLEHTESDVEKFAHGGADDLHFVFAVASQALTEVERVGMAKKLS